MEWRAEDGRSIDGSIVVGGWEWNGGRHDVVWYGLDVRQVGHGWLLCYYVGNTHCGEISTGGEVGKRRGRGDYDYDTFREGSVVELHVTVG